MVSIDLGGAAECDLKIVEIHTKLIDLPLPSSRSQPSEMIEEFQLPSPSLRPQQSEMIEEFQLPSPSLRPQQSDMIEEFQLPSPSLRPQQSEMIESFQPIDFAKAFETIHQNSIESIQKLTVETGEQLTDTPSLQLHADEFMTNSYHRLRYVDPTLLRTDLSASGLRQENVYDDEKKSTELVKNGW